MPWTWRPAEVPRQRPLYTVTDNGQGKVIPPERFAPTQRDGGWGPFVDSFIRFNRTALDALALTPTVEASPAGAQLRLVPSGRAGAIPLRSAQTGHVAAGFIVKPRFGWSGIGRVLAETGWHAGPEFLDVPLVPGSGREVPPWVLAGPVLARLRELLQRLRPGYRQAEEILRQPRGRIMWPRYLAQSFPRGRWHHMPCRFPDLDTDPKLRRAIRWTLERIHRELTVVGGRDRIALQLATLALQLIELVSDVEPQWPGRDLLTPEPGSRLMNALLERGLQAISWIVEERGLGGGRELDGLAWQLPLDRLWEQYVETLVRREATLKGGAVRVARLRETIFPLRWSDPTHRSMTQLVPDIVVRYPRSIHVVDAKYKAHLAELDDVGWHRFVDEQQEAHRADVHQVLAYASLYDAEEVTATLVYPLRADTWGSLNARGRDLSTAELFYGRRRVTLQMRGVPFGGAVRETSSNSSPERGGR